MLLILSNTSGLLGGSAPLGTCKDLALGTTVLGSRAGDGGSEEWAGQLYREESGSATLLPRSGTFFQRQRSPWFGCVLYSCNSPFGRDFWKENLLHSSVPASLLL